MITQRTGIVRTIASGGFGRFHPSSGERHRPGVHALENHGSGVSRVVYDWAVSRLRVAALSLALIATVLAGCGGDGGSNDDGNRPSASGPSSTNTASDARTQLRTCVKKFGARLASDPPKLEGRVAVGGAGNLPATYLGAVVFRNGAYSDVWLADKARDGAATADKLNEAQAASQGVTEVEAAYSDGRVASAPGNTKAFGELDLDKEAGGLDRCLSALND